MPRRAQIACAVLVLCSAGAAGEALAVSGDAHALHDGAVATGAGTGDAAMDAAEASDAARRLLPAVEVVATPLRDALVSVTDPRIARQPLPPADGAAYLKTIPGFASIRSGGANGDPVLRGMFGSRLNLLADGAPTQGACPSRMDSPTSYIAPESYDKVTVIKGPQSVRYGPGGSAGTVLFERDTPRFDEAGVRADGSVVGGSHGRNDENLDLSAGGPAGYARVIADKSNARDYRDGDGRDVPSAWNKWNAGAAFGLTPDAHTKLELTAGIGDGYARYAGRSMDGVRFRRDSFGLRFTKRNPGGALERFDAQLFYSDADHRMDNYTLRAPAPGSMAMVSNVRRRSLGGRVDTTFALAETLHAAAGADALSHDVMRRSASGRASPAGVPWTPGARLSNVGLFGELTWEASATQRVLGGARLDRAEATDKRRTVGGSMGGAAGNPTAGATRARYLPSAFARYEQSPAALPVTWYAGVGHTERFPDYWELFSAGRGPSGAVNAFAAVAPEKTTQLDIGAHYRTRALDAWVSAYAGYVSDFILFAYGAGGTSQVLNVNAQILGGEFGAEWRPHSRWRLGMAGAYAWGRRAGEPLPQMPPLDVRVTADYRWRAWSAGALWRVVAPQHRYARQHGNVVGQDFGPSAGFGVVSLHTGYDVSKTTQIALGVDNLFDNAYAEHLNLAGNAGFGYPAHTPVTEPGRLLWGRVRFRM